MVLEGTVTNVTNFGAFVDVGVHQDGLVHISVIADKFIKDPREVVKAGDIVKVKVMEIDIPRNRIGLSMRMGDEPGKSERGAGRSDRNSTKDRSSQKRSFSAQPQRNARAESKPETARQGTMGALLQQAMKGKQ